MTQIRTMPTAVMYQVLRKIVVLSTLVSSELTNNRLFGLLNSAPFKKVATTGVLANFFPLKGTSNLTCLILS
jgi:hypothetical protein